MEDNEIVALYWERNETAIAETEKKYGRYCYVIAYNVLYCHEDAEECVNDTYPSVTSVSSRSTVRFSLSITTLFISVCSAAASSFSIEGSVAFSG